MAEDSATLPAQRDAPTHCPRSDYDLYSDANLIEPHDGNRALRDLGGVVWLSRLGIYALPRYETTRAALANWGSFSSARGVMLNDVMNGFMKGSLLCSDPPEHDDKRKVIMKPLVPSALKLIRDDINDEASTLVDALCDRGSFEAVTDLAEHLPLTIVAKRVGLPPVKREGMLAWSKASFDCIGPIETERTQRALAMLPEMGDFVRDHSSRDKVAADSWLGGLYRSADEGLIPHEACGPMSIDYIGPSLDTTISALSSAIYLFARHPEQWEMIRARPSLIPNAINEIVRLEAPIQAWTRYVTQDTDLGGVTIEKDSRVLVMFGSANRDERKWDAPDSFDVNRQVADHVGFGHGEHACAGANLARTEIIAILSALAPRVQRFILEGPAVREATQATRSWSSIPVRLELQ